MSRSRIAQANEKIEKSVVDGYKKIETSVVGAYKQVEEAFVDRFLTRDGETVADVKTI